MNLSLEALKLVINVLEFEFADVSDHRTFGAARETDTSPSPAQSCS